MGRLKLILLVVIVLVSSFVWCQAELPESPEDEAIQLQLLLDGRKLLDARKPAEAITECFDRVINNFKAKYGDYKEQIYCARTKSETLMYLLMASKEKRNAKAVSAVWSDAYFMKGYALIDLGRISEAKSYIEQALVLSPHNSEYLSELGHIYQVEKNWPKSLAAFKAAEDAANSFSPEENKKFELARARRGVGYVLVEMGQLDQAEEKYRQCIESDPTDGKAKAEFEYIRKLKMR